MPDEETRPLVFISHRSDDILAAQKLAERLEKISNKIDIYLAHDPRFEGPRVGQPLNRSLTEALGHTSLVILIFSVADEDWSYCTWECGVATDPNDSVPTNVVTFKLTNDAPKPLGETLMVNANDPDSILTFVNQFCTDPEFIPGRGVPLSDRPANDGFFIEQAQHLYDELLEFTTVPDVKEIPRWGGFRISLDAALVEKIRKSTDPPDSELLDQLMTNAFITHPKGWGLEHFGYANLETGMNLADLRSRWDSARGTKRRLKNTPWHKIIGEEIWRIVTSRPTNLTWEPFLSLRDGSNLWVYPIVYLYRRHSQGRYEFDLLIVQTKTPQIVED